MVFGTFFIKVDKTGIMNSFSEKYRIKINVVLDRVLLKESEIYLWISMLEIR
jgi:hypothetical protein